MSTLELRINNSDIYRTLVRECYQKTNYIIVQQHKFDDVWSTTKSISVPKSIVAEMLLFFEENRAEGTPPAACNDDIFQNELKINMTFLKKPRLPFTSMIVSRCLCMRTKREFIEIWKC